MPNRFAFAAIGSVLASETSVQLNNGVDMPVMSFAAQTWSDAVCKSATTDAITAGFRFIWSSALIGTSCQEAQGQALAASDVDRSELFISGTVNTGYCSGLDSCYQQTLQDSNAQFTILGQDKLDMLMLDYPTQSCDGIAGQWKAFEELYSAGRVRSIAVSNFDSDQLACLGANATVPVVNQLHFSVGSSITMIEDNAKLGIVVQSYSPLDSGRLVHDTDCANIGSAHGKSAAQVAFKWILQHNGTVATQSTNIQHLQEDIDIFDFMLSDDEMNVLDGKSNSVMV
jgi:diketogulonate reductase-like aldo/keto reductase